MGELSLAGDGPSPWGAGCCDAKHLDYSVRPDFELFSTLALVLAADLDEESDFSLSQASNL